MNTDMSDVELPAVANAISDRYVVGVHLGESHDPAAIGVVHRVDYARSPPLFQVGHLERLPLGMPYPGVVNRVTHLLERSLLQDNEVELVVGSTGQRVFDMFRVRGVSTRRVTVVGGGRITFDGPVWQVPKPPLVSRVQDLFNDGGLTIHEGLAEAPALIAELRDFDPELTDSGDEGFTVRSGKHDALVLAVAIALWRAE